MTSFDREMEDRIAANAANESLRLSATALMKATIPTQYSYNFSWLGRPIIQYPQDIVAMQELLWSVKPDIIIETGIAHGGSLIFSASMLELNAACGGPKDAQVIGVDIDIRAHNRTAIEAHPLSRRIKMIQGSSIAPDIVEDVWELAAGKERVLVCLDSNHTHDHVLAELEAARLEVVRQVNARAVTRVPVGAAAGFGLWCLEQMSGRPGRDGVAGIVWNAVCLVGIGAMAGYYSASRDSSAGYARLYLGRVLPLLAARFGDLSFRSPAQLDLQALNSERLFDDYDSAVSDNEFFGTHRGLPISIATLLLTSGSGKQRRVSFEGLLVEVTLPRGLQGTTAVIAGTGAFEQLRHWLKTSNRQHVALEDPRFAQVYDVWSTDQIAARALLTPALMERLLALSGPAANIDGRPLVVARDNRLTLIIPRYGRDHFLAPGFRKAADSRASLIALYDQIAGVLAVADAVIGLDQAARSVAAESPSRTSVDA